MTTAASHLSVVPNCVMRQDSDFLERLEKIRGVMEELDRMEQESGRALEVVDYQFKNAA